MLNKNDNDVIYIYLTCIIYFRINFYCMVTTFQLFKTQVFQTDIDLTMEVGGLEKLFRLFTFENKIIN